MNPGWEPRERPSEPTCERTSEPPCEPSSIPAIAVQEGPQRTTELGWEVVLAYRMQQRKGRLVGLELRDAARAFGEVAFQVRVHVGRQMMLQVICQEPDDVGAGAVVRRMGHRGLVACQPPTPNAQLPKSLEVVTRSLGVGNWELGVDMRQFRNRSRSRRRTSRGGTRSCRRPTRTRRLPSPC